MWSLSERGLYCVRTTTLSMSELTQLLSAKSMIRYLPPNGTAGLARFSERIERRAPSPPARITARVRFMHASSSRGRGGPGDRSMAPVRHDRGRPASGPSAGGMSPLREPHTKRRGLTKVWLYSMAQWRCGPVVRPVIPTYAMTSPAFTACPAETVGPYAPLSTWAYHVSRLSLW